MSEVNTYQANYPPMADGEERRENKVDAQGNHAVSLGTALDDVNDSITAYRKCSYANLAASALIKAGAGQVYGILVNSHTGGSVKLWDNTAGSGTVLANTITFSATDRFIPLEGATFGAGLYATIGGTADLTILYR